MQNKTAIRELIGAGELETAASAALSYAEYCGLTDIANALTTVSSRAQDMQQKWTSGQLAYGEFSTAHAKVTHDLTAWVSRLPDQPKPASPRRRFLTESRFKNHLFVMLLICKAVVLLRLWYHWSTGGFNDDQFQGTFTLLLTAFVAFIGVALTDLIRQQQEGPQPPRYVSGPLVKFAYLLLPLYALALLLCIELKARTSISFTAMNTGLGLVELGLGRYIGKVVNGLFKKGD